jgi:hypothetical protein
MICFCRVAADSEVDADTRVIGGPTCEHAGQLARAFTSPPQLLSPRFHQLARPPVFPRALGGLRSHRRSIANATESHLPIDPAGTWETGRRKTKNCKTTLIPKTDTCAGWGGTVPNRAPEKRPWALRSVSPENPVF